MQRNKTSKRNIDYILYLALAIALLGILWVQFCAPDKKLGLNTETAHLVDTSWEISWDGQKEDRLLPATIQNPQGKEILLKTTLYKLNSSDNSILFYSRQSRTIVSLDGEEIWDSGEAVSEPFPFSQGSFWNSVRLPGDWEGKELTIKLIPQFSEAAIANELPAIYMGTKTSFLYKIVHDASFNILFCNFMILFGIFDILLAVFYIHRAKATQIFYLGLFALSTGTWILLESHVIQILSGNIAMNYYILNISFELMPLLAVRFLLTFDEVGKKRYMQIIYGTGILLFLLIRGIITFGLAYEFQAQFLIRIYVVIALLGLLAAVVSSSRQTKQWYTSKLNCGIYILLASTILELLRFYFITRSQSGIILCIGLCILITYFGIVIIQEGRQLRIDDFEKQRLSAMAYTDGLTKMKNRAAFEEKLEMLKKIPQSDYAALVMIADINDLKHINDTYGHSSGDDAICRIGELLERNFNSFAECFRIGGDEFCIIADNMDVDAFEKKVHMFQQQVDAQKTIYNLCISIGMDQASAQDVDQTFRVADKKMYACKKRMKEQQRM